MDKRQIRDQIFNIRVLLETKQIGKEEREKLKVELEYYRKELSKVIYNEMIEKNDGQKKEGIINEIGK